MATKSYKLRLDLRKRQPVVDPVRFGNDRVNETRQVQQWLDDTLKAFNDGVRYLCGWLLGMHRGAAIYREKKDGIWREWQPITTLDELNAARSRQNTDPSSVALLENATLLNVFNDKGKSEAEAVELAECCRRIVEELCPPSTDEGDIQVSSEFRHALDPLTNPASTAFDLRPRGHTKDGRPKKVSGQRPGWLLDRAIWEEACNADSLDALCDALRARSEFQSATKKGAKRLAALQNRYKNGMWAEVREQIIEPHTRQFEELLAQCDCLEHFVDGALKIWNLSSDQENRRIKSIKRKHGNATWEQAKEDLRLLYAVPRWQAAKIKSDRKREASEAHGSIAAYRKLLDYGCLPIPTFQRPVEFLDSAGLASEWNYAMWNVAGQRVRSHLGWARRRERERLVWELRKSLFERGGWERIRHKGKETGKAKLEKAVIDRELGPEDLIRFDAPPTDQADDFKERPGYSNSAWVKTLRQYETDEMLKHLEGVAFGAAEQPCIRQRTAKGWAKVRDRWREVIAKAQKDGNVPSSCDLLEAFDQMRSRKARDFGDRRLFEWLAAPERRWLWDRTDRAKDNCGRDDRDCVLAFIAHNEHLADRPKSITFTRSDPVKHPVWPFFGENSAVEYWLAREDLPNGAARLVLVLRQLLARQPDGSRSAVDRVKIALRGYDDFEKSFTFPEGVGEVSPKQQLVFRDDLIGGQQWKGKLSGLKLMWERSELEAHNRKRHSTKSAPRIYASFSCEAGKDIKVVRGKEVLFTGLPAWLTNAVGYLDTKNARDGVKGLFKLDGGIRFEGRVKKSEGEDSATAGTPRLPGAWVWPKEAIENGFTVRGTDLGHRTSSAGAWWRLSTEAPNGTVDWLQPARLSFQMPSGKIAWQIGTCENKPVYAVLERTSTVSLPGDGEALPPAEQELRDRLYSLRTRLNLNNALLRIARLLTLEAITQRKPDGDKVRKRSDGTTKRIGTKWRTETRNLDEPEIKENCRKAAEMLVRWESTDAMTESLKEIGHEGPFRDWLATRDDEGLKRLADVLPTEKEAKEKVIDRDARKAERNEEDDAFAEAVYELRKPLAQALCDRFVRPPKKRGRAATIGPAQGGLWFKFDRALLRELSYGDRGKNGRARRLFEDGLFRLLRKPPVTKHQDRKDDANNLPHGQTHRGGLSMIRLRFLEDVKNFVRRWSCRPRWPGDVRRVPRDAKVNRGDTKHLDNLREHRAKLIAHADVAQTLGFEQDLRRGVWLYRAASSREDQIWHRPERCHLYQWQDSRFVKTTENAPSHAVRAHDLAHVLVYEDLTRYRMKSDRPKNENAGLARWSHRRILAFAQHIGGLFGVPVATVDARFSSRYCSYCGAPGSRAERFDPDWLGQSWLRRIRRDTNDRTTSSRNMREVADEVEQTLQSDSHAYHDREKRPWVLRDGGSEFVCSNNKCDVHENPISADANAAANVGLRFLRGIDAIRIYKTAAGTPTKPIGYISPEQVMRKVSGADYWIMQPKEQVSEVQSEDSSAHTLFRDPSGACLSADRWYERKKFWGIVASKCASALGAANASRWSEDESDDED